MTLGCDRHIIELMFGQVMGFRDHPTHSLTHTHRRNARTGLGEARAPGDHMMVIPPLVRLTAVDELGSPLAVEPIMMPNEAVLFVPALAVAL